MLNPFPIQFLALFAYFLLRVFVGGILFYLGLKHFKLRHELRHAMQLPWFPYGYFVATTFAASELIIGTFLIAGAHTQYATLAIMIMSLKMLVMRNWFEHPSLPPKIFYVLLLGTSLSLFITGAGAFAFDLPI